MRETVPVVHRIAQNMDRQIWACTKPTWRAGYFKDPHWVL